MSLPLRYILICCLFFISSQIVAETPSSASNNPLSSFLNADGTLRLSSGFSGALDVKGYRMSLDANGTPRFFHNSESAAVPEDSLWDARFGMNGLNGTVRALVAVGTDLYAAGTFTQAGGTTVANIARWDGSRWNALGSGVNGTVYSLTAVGTQLYVGGTFSLAGGVNVNNIAMWNGAAWSALGVGINGVVSALVSSGSNVYAGGTFGTAGGGNASNIARWNGSVWSALGTGTNGSVTGLAVRGTDLFAGGVFETAGGTGAANIARWNGSNWSALGTGIAGEVYALAVDSNGTDVYAGGLFSTAGGVSAKNIARWNGSAWNALGSGTDSSVYALSFKDSVLSAGGAFDSAGGSGWNRVAQWNGSNWTAAGSGFDTHVRALRHVSDGEGGFSLFAGGEFNFSGASATGKIAVLVADAWNPVGSSLGNLVFSVFIRGVDVYVGGAFVGAGTTHATRIAKWNGSAWSALGDGISGTVYAITVAPNGTDVYAGGLFTQAGGVDVENIARWNGSQWMALGTGLNAGVYCLEMNGNTLYAGGDFTTAGGVSAAYIAQWNGSAWSALGSGMNARVRTLEFFNANLYAGGTFTTAGGPTANRVARWNGTAWSTLGSGTDGEVFSLVGHGTTLYAGGDFLNAGGSPAASVASWNGSSWSALGNGTDATVFCLDVGVNPDGEFELYAGGDFSTAGTVAANSIAKWNGVSWEPLGSGVLGIVTTLSVNGGNLYAGGSFFQAGGKPSYFFGHWGNGASVTFSVNDEWNLVSIPLLVDDFSKSFLFPTSTSNAFSFLPGSGYSSQTSLANGTGYWLKFTGSQTVSLFGFPRPLDTIDVAKGWNLIGSVSMPVAVSAVTSIPGGIATSSFYSYAGGYTIADTIHPGKGYWINATENGKLVLNASGSLSASSRINIVETTELPPPPPEEETGSFPMSVPVSSGLAQNYPNPFNPETNFEFRIANGGLVTLKIFDLLGKEITTLVNEELPPGTYQRRWNAANVAAGVYFYRLQATPHTSNGTAGTSFTEIRKLLLIK